MENENQDTPNTSVEGKGSTQKGWGRSIVIGGVALVALAGVGLAAARSADFGWEHGGRHFGMGGHMDRASMHGRGGFGEHRLERLLEEIDATPEQSEKLKAIFGTARGNIAPMMEGMMDARESAVEIIGAPTIDRAAAEKLRSDRIAAIDAASRTMTAAILEAAEVLTPEQRADLMAHFKERGGRGRW